MAPRIGIDGSNNCLYFYYDREQLVGGTRPARIRLEDGKPVGRLEQMDDELNWWAFSSCTIDDVERRRVTAILSSDVEIEGKELLLGEEL